MSNILFNSLIKIHLNVFLTYRDLYSLPDKLHLHCHEQESLHCYGHTTFVLLSIFYNLNSIPADLENSLVNQVKVLTPLELDKPRGFGNNALSSRNHFGPFPIRGPFFLYEGYFQRRGCLTESNCESRSS